MNITASEQVIMLDIDNTLVMSGEEEDHGAMAIRHPNTGQTLYVRPHLPHIRVVKERYARGAKIFAWSHGGYAWAAAVISLLGLDEYIHHVMSKPVMYIDDSNPESILGTRLYMREDDPYR